MKKKSMDWYKLQQRFSVRKYHFGAASVLLGTALVFGGAQASADEVTAPATPSTESTTATSAETTTASEGAPAVLTASEGTPASLTASESSSSTEATSLDKGALQVALSQAKALDLSHKTSETVAILLAQIEHAQTVLNTATSQEELNQAVTDLQAAQAQLADKPAEESKPAVASTEAASEKAAQPATTPVSVTPATPASSEASQPSEKAAQSEAKPTVVAPTSVAPATETSEESSASPVVTSPARSHRTRRSVAAVASAPKVTFYDATGNEVTPATIVDGKDGKNIALNMKIEMPDEATDRKVTVTLGNFLSFVDNPGTEGVDGAGQTNETVKLSAKLGEVKALENTITDKNGIAYKKTGGQDFKQENKYSTSYTIAKGISEITIPLNLQVDYRARLKGMSSSGTLSGSTDLIEHSTPVVATVGTDIVGKIDNLHLDVNQKLGMTAIPIQAKNAAYTTSNNINGYQADIGFVLWTSSVSPGDFYHAFIEKGSSVDFVLPSGVSYVGLPGGAETIPNYTVSTIGVDPAGNTRMRLTFAEPYRYGEPESQIRIHTPALSDGSYVTVRFDNFNIITRDANDRLIMRDARYPSDTPNPNFYRDYIVAVKHYDDGEKLAFGQDAVAGLVNDSHIDTVTNPAILPSGVYTPLGNINARPLAVNLSPNDTSEKEVHYSFPSYSNIEVTGVFVNSIENGSPITTAKVRSKNNPNLHEVTLPRDFGFANREEGYKWIGLKELGLAENDVLTELILPVGKIPGGYSVTENHTKNFNFSTSAFGRYLAPANANQVVANMELRDRDYNPADPNKNKTTGILKVQATTSVANDRTELYVTTPVSTEISSGSEGSMTYEVSSYNSTQDTTYPVASSKIAKAYVVLPSDVKVKSINVISRGRFGFSEPVDQNITSRVAQSQRVDGNNTIYELDLTGINDKTVLTGSVADYEDSQFKDRTVRFEVNVENNVDKKKVVNLDKTFFVVPTSVEPHVGDMSVQADPYNLNPNHSYVFTNRPTTNTLTLSKYNKLGIDSEAKLNTDPAYVDASNTFKLESTNQNIDLKYTVKNPNNAEAANVEMYIPVPKEGQNWGANFQSTPFNYGLALKSPATVDPAFNTVYDVEYATVDASKLDGSTDHNALTLAHENYTANPTNLNDVNLIRIKTKAGVKIPANSALPVELSYKVVNATNADDGQTLGWSPYYKAQFDDYTSLNNAATTKLQLTLGSANVQAFNDANANGSKDGADALTGLTYRILDENNKVVAETTSKTSGPVLTTGLVSGKTYTVVATNPDAGTYKFTNGTSSADRTTSTYTVVAAINGSSNVPTVSIGLATRTLADKTDPVGQGVPAKHGETPVAASGIANTGDMPSGTTYDWKAQPDTSTPGVKPSTVLVKYSDGSVDEVPVNVTVAPQAEEYTPVGQDVPAKHGTTPNAADGIANKGDLPSGTTYTWKTPVDTTTPGDKPGTVVVTYPDGTSEEVPTTVKVQPQSDEFTPTAKDVSVKRGGTPNAADGIANKGDLPTGTTYIWKTPVDTTAPGDKPGTVVVTYPDGTSEEVPTTVKIQPQSDEFTPTAQDVPVKHGETPNASDGIANKGDLPAGTTYAWKTPVDTNTPGDKPGTVVVTYPDGTTDEVPVTVKVQPQSDEFTPTAKDVPVKHGETPNASDGIANKGDLPAGTTYSWKTPVDTNTAGDKPGTVVVTYPDGTSEEVPTTVKVQPQSDEFTPTAQDVPAKHGATPNAADGIANKGDLPAGTTYTWKTPVDTTTPGDKPGTVVVTYPDGTSEEVPTTVKVQPQTDEFTPTAQDVPAKHGATPNAADGIANKGDLPAGTTYDWKTPVDTTTPGDKPGTVVVTYPDGTKDEVPVTVKVKPQSDEFTPNGQDVPAKHGETPKAEDGIANKGDLPNGTKYDWKTPVDTTTPGDKPGTVVVTYPDGTKDEVPVTVKVKPQSDEFAPQSKDVSTDHGKTPKAEDGIANKGDLPDGTKYDWKTPVDTTTPGDKSGTVVVTYPDGTKDEVPVTVHIGSQSDLYNPDGQNLNVKQGDQPEASKGVANRGNLPDGTTYDWKAPVDTSTVGDKPGTVVVTYPDGSKDEVPVTVKVTEKLHVKTPADKVPVKDPSNLTPDDINKVVENIKKENPGLPDDAKITVNPNGGDTTIETKDGDKVTIPGTDLVRPETDADKNNVKVPADKVPIKDPSNLTDAEKAKVADNIKKSNPDLPVGTKVEVGDDGTATVTFPDGSTKVIPGTDLVRPETDADKNNVKVPADKVPVKDPSHLTDAEKAKVADNIKKSNPDLPAGTKVEVGDDGTATITFPDGSTKVIPGTDLVRPETDADKNNVKVPTDKVPVKDPSNLTDAEKDKVKDNIKKSNPDLPNGTKIDVDKDGTATITFPDGSTKVIPGADLVRPETDADKNNVKVPTDKVPVKDPSNLTDAEKDKVKDNIKKSNPDLPNGTKIDVDKDGTATITFPDGSTKVIPGTDLVRPETDADKNNVKVPADKVPVKDPSHLTDAEKAKVVDNIKKSNPDLPAGTKVEVGDDGTATVTFPDGSTKVIPGADLVRPETDADRHTPKGQDVPVKQGETPKVEGGIANKGDLPNGTKIEWKETPDTSKVGDHSATIVITYPDGSKDEVTVTVKVSPNTNNNGNNGNNSSHGNGNSGSHNNGTNGDQGRGDKDKKDQTGKDTNNGLGKLFSNSGNGSASGDQSVASRKQAPALPNTGDASNPAMALAFAALLGGTALAMKKRKKEEEE